MSKRGFCPVCKQAVKRSKKREVAHRINVVPHHYALSEMCKGSGLLWKDALRRRVHYIIAITELPDKDL